MSMPRVYVRDGSRATIGVMSNWTELQYIQRRNEPGRWTITTSSVHDADLISPPMDGAGVLDGARGVIIRLDGDDGEPITLASGWLEGYPLEKNENGATTWIAAGFDDTVLLQDSLGWPLPGEPIEEQVERDDVREGQASDRIRAYALANISQRLQIPGFGTGSEWHRLGPEGTSRSRFDNLLDIAKEAAGKDLNFRVIQQETDSRTLLLEQWVPPDKRLEVQFSPQLGTVTGWEHTYEPVESSRVILGLAGEDEDRVFREYSGHITEQELGGVRKIETFEDKRDIATLDDEGDPVDGWEQEAMDHARTYLEERRLRPRFTFTLTGGPGMRAGVNFNAGDLVRAYKTITPNGEPIGLVEDLITETSTTWNADGEKCEVRIGGEDGFGLRTERKLRRAMQRIRFLERQK